VRPRMIAVDAHNRFAGFLELEQDLADTKP